MKTEKYLCPECEATHYEPHNVILTGSGEDWQEGED